MLVLYPLNTDIFWLLAPFALFLAGPQPAPLPPLPPPRRSLLPPLPPLLALPHWYLGGTGGILAGNSLTFITLIDRGGLRDEAQVVQSVPSLGSAVSHNVNSVFLCPYDGGKSVYGSNRFTFC